MGEIKKINGVPLQASVPPTTTITINGDTQDLSTDRTWNVNLQTAYENSNIDNEITLNDINGSLVIKNISEGNYNTFETKDESDTVYFSIGTYGNVTANNVLSPGGFSRGYGSNYALMDNYGISYQMQFDMFGRPDYGVFNNIFKKELQYFTTSTGVSTFTSLFRNGTLALAGNTAHNGSLLPQAIQFASTAVAGTIGYLRGSGVNGLNKSIFSRFRFNVVSANMRFFKGVSAQYTVSNPTNVAINTLINCVGVGREAGAAFLSFYCNDNSGLCTVVATTIPYTTASLYDMQIYMNGSTSVSISLRLNNGAVAATTTFTTNFPSSTEVYPVAFITNNTDATAVSFVDCGYASISIFQL